MEKNRQLLHISEYSISETTLEQIFIMFARQQEEETGAVEGFSADNALLSQDSLAPHSYAPVSPGLVHPSPRD